MAALCVRMAIGSCLKLICDYVINHICGMIVISRR